MTGLEMKRKYVIASLALLLCNIFCLKAQNDAPEDSLYQRMFKNLYAQLLVQPQEKIYVQTDRPYYLNGEKIYFRAFLLQAANQKAASWSRYVYIELISPGDSVVVRQQIRQTESGMYFGTLHLPESLPEGSYRLRAYTRYLENSGEDFFYTQPVYIADPNASQFSIENNLSYMDDNNVRIRLRFRDKKSGELALPESLVVSGQKIKSAKLLKPDGDNFFSYIIRLDASTGNRYFLIQFKDKGRTFKKYVYVPYLTGFPGVNFYPEGGHLVADKTNVVAFKALNSNGTGAELSGAVFNSKGAKIVDFKTMYKGMGKFLFQPLSGETYYAQVDFQGKSNRVELPVAQLNACSLRAESDLDSLAVAVISNQQNKDKNYYLLIHRQGIPIYLQKWNASANKLRLPKRIFNTGVTHLLLLSDNMHVLAERLVFNNKKDQYEASVSTDKTVYKQRNLVHLCVDVLSDPKDSLVSEFAVAVTDDKDIQTDSVSNIISEIYLTSELKGTVEHPAWYFSDDSHALEYADLLMMTNGWRKYNIQEALLDSIQKPVIQPEKSQNITGDVKGFLGRNSKNAKVKLLAMRYGYVDEASADEKGMFGFTNFELPDSTALFMMCFNKTGEASDVMELRINPILYPMVPRTSLVTDNLPDMAEVDRFAWKANRKYINEKGMRQIDLPEVVVTQSRKSVSRIDNHTGISDPDRFISTEQIQRFSPTSLEQLFSYIPGVQSVSSGDGVKIRNQNADFVLDGINLHCTFGELDGYINVADIAQVDVYVDPAKTLVLSSGNPVIALTTWPAGLRPSKLPNSILNKKVITPLGYQKPDEFYSPKYETPAALNDQTPDLRTTIYWNPNVVLKSGTQSCLDFYTNDSRNTTYTVIVEGITSGKKLIYSRKKGVVKQE